MQNIFLNYLIASLSLVQKALSAETNVFNTVLVGIHFHI